MLIVLSPFDNRSIIDECPLFINNCPFFHHPWSIFLCPLLIFHYPSSIAWSAGPQVIAWAGAVAGTLLSTFSAMICWCKNCLHNRYMPHLIYHDDGKENIHIYFVSFKKFQYFSKITATHKSIQHLFSAEISPLFVDFQFSPEVNQEFSENKLSSKSVWKHLH